jgi:hypothetical protein
VARVESSGKVEEFFPLSARRLINGLRVDFGQALSRQLAEKVENLFPPFRPTVVERNFALFKRINGLLYMKKPARSNARRAGSWRSRKGRLRWKNWSPWRDSNSHPPLRIAG